MTTGLIITADDFGLHPRVNTAVAQAHRHGVLTAASLMVTGPAARQAVEMARQLPGLRTGLHLVLADGFAALPASRIPGLVNRDGRFAHTMAGDGLRFVASRGVRRELAMEIRAQFELFARTGLLLDHVNTHKHFHLHPIVLGLVLAIGKDYGLRAVRLPAEPTPSPLLRPWLATVRSQLDRVGIGHNDTVFGLRHSGRFTEPELLRVLRRIPPGLTEIYLHPASPGPRPITASMRRYQHAAELAALVSPRVRSAVHQAAVPLGGFGDFPTSGGEK